MPLVRRTLAIRGHPPLLRHRARQRDKVSAAAALTLSPQQRHVGLYFQTYPMTWVNNEIYTQFLHTLLRQLRRPLVLVHDRGSMHRGPTLRSLAARYPRLDLNLLPPYAPELNPVEQLWNFAKDKDLCNYVPSNVADLDRTVCGELESIRQDQDRLRSFFIASALPNDPLTLSDAL